MSGNWKKYFFKEMEKRAWKIFSPGNIFWGATTIGGTAMDVAANKAQVKSVLSPKKLENDYGYMFDKSTVNLRNQNRSLFR